MDVLVTGAAGFIGRNLLPRLASEGHQCYGIHRSPAELPAIDGVEWIASDLAQADPTAGWPGSIDALIFAAQSSQWRDFPKGAQDIFDVNVRAVFQAVEYARRSGAQHFIFLSTGSVYAPSGAPVSETHPIKVQDLDRFYDATKLAAEFLLRPYQQHFNTVILRLFTPYGPGLSQDMLMSQLVKRVREQVPVTLDGEDGLLINPIYVDDLVEVLMRGLTLEGAHTLNVAGAETYTLRAIANQIGETLGETVQFEQRADRQPPVLVGDISRLTQLLDWTPSISLAEGLKAWLAA